MAEEDLDDFNENLLHYLAEKEDIAKLECLSKCSVLDYLINQSRYGLPSKPLSIAITQEMLTMAEKMVELGALIDDIGHMDRDKVSPIGHAVMGGHVNLVKKMLQIGISLTM